MNAQDGKRHLRYCIVAISNLLKDNSIGVWNIYHRWARYHNYITACWFSLFEPYSTSKEAPVIDVYLPMLCQDTKLKIGKLKSISVFANFEI